MTAVAPPRTTDSTARPYQICTRCIMDTSDPLIQFDARGECNHCKTYDVRVAAEVHSGPAGAAELERLVAHIKALGRGRDYDCIAGVSGGVDSTTAIWHLKRLGLRPLAVHFDNGWNSELAVDNIHRTLKTLGVELYTHVVDWDEFRDLQLSFLRASVPNCEIPTDHAISALLFRVAQKIGTRIIIGGGNVATEAIMPVAWTYYNQDLRHLKAVHRRFGSVPLRTMPTVSLPGYAWHVLGRRVRIVRLLNYVGYQKTEAKALIQRELGWRDYGGKHYESIYTRFYQGYILPVKFGFDKRRPHYSNLICAGDLTREQALADIQEPSYAATLLREDRAFVVKKLGLTDDEFEGLMALPIRRHEDYPGHHWVFHELRSLKVAFKRIATST